MEDQPSIQPAETLAQLYLRAGQALIAELGARAAPAVLTENATAIDAVSLESGSLAIGALDKMRLFVQEKATQTKETFQNLRHNPRRILALGALGAAVAATKPVVEAGVERAPILRELDSTPAVSAAETQDTGGYPWAEAPLGSQDKNGYPVRECTSYVVWKLESVGVNPKRLSVNLERLREQGEVIDSNPAVGSMAALPDQSHFMYVEEVTPEKIIVSQFNTNSNHAFSIQEYNRTQESRADTFLYVHFEIPDHPGLNLNHDPVDFEETVKPAQRFMGTRYDARNKNTIRLGHAIRSGTFIQSESGRFRLVFDKAGSGIKLWDVKGDYKVTWRKFLRGRTANQLRIKPNKTNQTRGKSSNVRQNVLTLGTSKKDFMRIPIGNATRIVLEDDGTFSGYRGKSKKPVWKGASNPARIARIARVAARKAARQQQK